MKSKTENSIKFNKYEQCFFPIVIFVHASWVYLLLGPLRYPTTKQKTVYHKITMCGRKLSMILIKDWQRRERAQVLGGSLYNVKYILKVITLFIQDNWSKNATLQNLKACFFFKWQTECFQLALCLNIHIYLFLKEEERLLAVLSNNVSQSALSLSSQHDFLIRSRSTYWK